MVESGTQCTSQMMASMMFGGSEPSLEDMATVFQCACTSATKGFNCVSQLDCYDATVFAELEGITGAFDMMAPDRRREATFGMSEPESGSSSTISDFNFIKALDEACPALSGVVIGKQTHDVSFSILAPAGKPRCPLCHCARVRSGQRHQKPCAQRNYLHLRFSWSSPPSSSTRTPI